MQPSTGEEWVLRRYRMDAAMATAKFDDYADDFLRLFDLVTTAGATVPRRGLAILRMTIAGVSRPEALPALERLQGLDLGDNLVGRQCEQLRALAHEEQDSESE